MNDRGPLDAISEDESNTFVSTTHVSPAESPLPVKVAEPGHDENVTVRGTTSACPLQAVIVAVQVATRPLKNEVSEPGSESIVRVSEVDDREV